MSRSHHNGHRGGRRNCCPLATPGGRSVLAAPTVAEFADCVDYAAEDELHLDEMWPWECAWCLGDERECLGCLRFEPKPPTPLRAPLVLEALRRAA